MFIFALIIFLVFLFLFVSFGLSVLYHLIKYRWPGDLNLTASAIFSLGSIVLIGLALVLFLSIPWPQ